MKQRKTFDQETEARVLMSSARRCALCYEFEGDLGRKKGQIAHIDQNPTNACESCLVYLCLEHHDEYDSRTSQIKGITELELRTYKECLIAAITAGEHRRPSKQPSVANARANAIRDHDKRVFGQADELMREKNLMDFLRQLLADDSYLLSQVHRLDDFRGFFSETGNQFIDEEASDKVNALLESIDTLLLFVAQHFFVYPPDQRRDDLRLCMYPNLNVDRDGPGTADSVRRYHDFQKQLDERVQVVRDKYKDYRLVAKHYLQV